MLTYTYLQISSTNDKIPETCRNYVNHNTFIGLYWSDDCKIVQRNDIFIYPQALMVNPAGVHSKVAMVEVEVNVVEVEVEVVVIQ